MRTNPILAACLILASTLAPAAMAEEARLLRFADIHGDQVAFVQAGDIWLGSTAGGLAHRLTSDEGMELFPKFSPDGRWIAYSAEYSGSRQIHVIGVDGGPPRQLTFYNDVGPMPPRGGFDYRVLDWTPDGSKILFRANRLPWGVRMGRPYLVPFEGGMEEPLAVPEGGGGMLSPDGKRLVYTPIDREWRTWKRHGGGRAQDVWIYDLESDTAQQITDWTGTDNQPVWVGDTIYFASDREGGRLNLWAFDTATGDSRQVTFHEEYDVLWPSAGPAAVVYENGGWLYRYDPATSETARIPLEITGDAPWARSEFRAVSDFVDDAGISPSGKRAVFSARGDLFTVPAENGLTRNLTRTQGVREMDGTWSPDGRWIAYLSDATGEYEIWLREQDGTGDARQITTGGDAWKFQPVWSPDGSKLAWGDRHQRLLYADVESGDVVEVDSSGTGDLNQHSWSPDSAWIAYAKIDDNQFSSLWVHEIATARNVRLSDETTNDYEPVFDPAGNYLYFLSDRDFNLTFSGYEFNYLYTDPTRIYAALLNGDSPRLFAPKNDEEEPAAEEGADEGDGDGKDDDDDGVTVVIEAEGLADRVVSLPVESGNYGGLQAVEGGLLFASGGGNGPPSLLRFSLESEEVETILAGVGSYEATPDGKKLLYQAGADWGIVEVAPGKNPGDGKLDLSGLEMKIDFQAEWRQIFADAWRITRDWFYDPSLHGVGWQAIRELYEPMVDHVRHRGDLDYILGEMGGELDSGHYYVNWGDMPTAERADNGLLGAELEADDSGYFRIAKILPGENWHDDFRSPLTEPGVDVAEGDFLIAVNGRSALEVDNAYRLLERTAGEVVTLTVNDTPATEGAREVSVRPIARETNLRYLEWVAERRRRVDELSGGRIGYIHLPNTAFEGNRELAKWFLPQANKEALILDARYNGGGFIPDRMIELLTREPMSFWARRGIAPFSTPGFFHEGPKACLINGYSSSGGDAFPFYFRQAGLGPLIGTRTWGGLIGLSGNPGFVDGGSVAVPTFRFYTPAGEWDVEDVGVAPDIEVVDRPDLVAKGHDPSLEKAVEVLLESLEANPEQEVTEPAPPVQSRNG